MKKIERRTVSATEVTRLLTADDSQGINYNDLKRMFSSEDLEEYDILCESFVRLIGDKSNKEQWDVVLDPANGLESVSTLNRIEELRARYNLPGKFHRIWRANPIGGNRFEYDEVSW